MQASHKLAEVMYQQAQAEQAAAGAQPGAEEAAGAQAGGTEPEKEKPASDGAVDADFEVVDEDKK